MGGTYQYASLHSYESSLGPSHEDRQGWTPSHAHQTTNDTRSPKLITHGSTEHYLGNIISPVQGSLNVCTSIGYAPVSSTSYPSRSQDQPIISGSSIFTPLPYESTNPPPFRPHSDALQPKEYHRNLDLYPNGFHYQHRFENVDNYALPPGEDDGQPLSTFALHGAATGNNLPYGNFDTIWPGRAMSDTPQISPRTSDAQVPASSPVQVPTTRATSPSEESLTEQHSYLNEQLHVARSRVRSVPAKLAPAAMRTKSIMPSGSRIATLPVRHHSVPSRKSRGMMPGASSRKAPERKICEICQQTENKKFEFRGQHELDRHNNKQHARGNKQWICLDPTPDNRHSWCKNCSAGKIYAINYNAAEHLRRGHLNPDGSERVGKKSRGVGTKGVKGRRSGRMPSIQDLISNGWMKPVTTHNTTESDDSNASDCHQEPSKGLKNADHKSARASLDESDADACPCDDAQATDGGHIVFDGLHTEEEPWRYNSDTRLAYMPYHNQAAHENTEHMFGQYHYYPSASETAHYFRPYGHNLVDSSNLSPVLVPNSQLSSPGLESFHDLNMDRY